MAVVVGLYLGLMSNVFVKLLLTGLILLLGVRIGDVRGDPRDPSKASDGYYLRQFAVWTLGALLFALIFVVFPSEIFGWLFSAMPRM